MKQNEGLNGQIKMEASWEMMDNLIPKEVS